MQKRTQHHLSVSTGKVMLRYKLPVTDLDISAVDIDCGRRRDRGSIQASAVPWFCDPHRRQSPLVAMHKTRVETLKYVQRQMNLVDEILTDIPFYGGGRDKRSWWSSGWSTITGLAEDDQVQEMQEVVNKLSEGIEEAASAWRSGSSTFLATVKIEERRVDALQEVARAQRESFLQFHREVLLNYSESNLRIKLLGHMQTALRDMVQLVGEIDHLYNSVVSLVNGKLSHFIVHHTDLQNSLNWFQDFLDSRNTGLVILHNHTNYYYEEAVFKVFKVDNHLIINLFIPLSLPDLLKPLSLYTVHAIPLASPDGDRTHHTRLKLGFEGLLYSEDVDYYVEVERMYELPAHDVINLQAAGLVLQSRTRKSCAMSLFGGRLPEIKRYCGYHVVLQRLEPKAYKLGDHKFLISNIPSVQIDCPAKNYSETVQMHGQQSILKLHCGCAITADKYYLVESTLDCRQAFQDEETSNITEQGHLINLPYLDSFINQGWLNEIEANFVFNQTISAHSFPPLEIEAAKYDDLLAGDVQRKIDLDEAINRTKKQQGVFSDLSDFLFSKLAQTHSRKNDFDLFNLWSWLGVITAIVAGLALFLGVTVHLRVKTLYVLLATSKAAKAAAPPVTIMLPSTATPDQYDIHQDIKQYVDKIQEILPVDVTLLIVIISVMIAVLIIWIYTKQKSVTIRTKLYLQLGNATTSLHWEINALEFMASHYSIVVPQNFLTFELEETFWGGTLYWTDGLVVTNQLFDMVVKTQRQLSVRAWQMKKLRNILGRQHYAVLLVRSAVGSLLEVVILKQWNTTADDYDRRHNLASTSFINLPASTVALGQQQQQAQSGGPGVQALYPLQDLKTPEHLSSTAPPRY